MFELNDKRRAYWLIDKYLAEDIDTLTFSDEYHVCFDIELNLDTLSKTEEKALGELSNVSGRFSEIESDHRKRPGLYYTAEEVRQKAAEVKRKLADYWPDELKE